MNPTNSPGPAAPEPNGCPAPEVALAEPPEVKEPEKQSKLASIWSSIAALAGTVVTKATDAAKWTLDKVGTGLGYALMAVDIAYSHTLKPVLNWAEYWVPGFGKFREAARMYSMVLLLIGAIIGALVAAEAGLGFFASLGLMAYGVVLVPWIVVTTPTLWWSLFVDLWTLSAIFIGIDVVFAWLCYGKRFWKTAFHLYMPGISEAIVQYFWGWEARWDFASHCA